MACPRTTAGKSGVLPSQIIQPSRPPPTHKHPFPSPVCCGVQTTHTHRVVQTERGWKQHHLLKNSFVLKTQNAKGLGGRTGGRRQQQHIRHHHLWIQMLRVLIKMQGTEHNRQKRRSSTSPQKTRCFVQFTRPSRKERCSCRSSSREGERQNLTT